MKLWNKEPAFLKGVGLTPRPCRMLTHWARHASPLHERMCYYNMKSIRTQELIVDRFLIVWLQVGWGWLEEGLTPYEGV
jgi:hypothetical protein